MLPEAKTMEFERIKHVLNSVMILSFLVFGILAGVLLLTNTPLTNSSVSLPFSFLFISLMTLISTGRIDERPQMIERYLFEWLVICIFGAVIGALAFTLA
jgi:uncharacterized membrane protein YbjE (DUF340 family)